MRWVLMLIPEAFLDVKGKMMVEERLKAEALEVDDGGVVDGRGMVEGGGLEVDV